MSELETTSEAKAFAEELSDDALDRGERVTLSFPGVCQHGCWSDEVSGEF